MQAESNPLSRLSRQAGHLRTMDHLPDRDPMAERAHRRRGMYMIVGGLAAVASLTYVAERAGMLDTFPEEGQTEQVGDPIIDGRSREQLMQAEAFDHTTTDGLVVMQDGTVIVPAESVELFLSRED